MEKILNVAQYIFNEYKKMSGTVIDEMKLHKLLYLSQRECFAILNEPLFEESFEAWKYGPVSRIVRSEYTQDGIACETKDINDDAAYIVRNVLNQYGYIESWKLSELTHKENSWKNARKNLLPSDNCNTDLSIDDIKKDAEKVRPYDCIWDMYYDEFEDDDEVENK